ncbi:hypothetical protein TWF730_008822 [Orbilia blumenaviensis]|uniref:Uncharacterized protein n=1 Tax=Orbilia blumenaviensis TaxID=1796055 RepID=A0AAV9V3G1_9PEZI
MRLLPRTLAAFSLLVPTLVFAQEASPDLSDRDCTTYFRQETFTDSPWLWASHITNFDYDKFFKLNLDLIDRDLSFSSQNITRILLEASRTSRVRPTQISYPLAVSYETVKATCGATSGLYAWALISDTLTTWILPLFGLIVSLPWGSNGRGHTILMIFRWIGSPFASLTYIFWNLRAIGRAAILADLGTPRPPRKSKTQRKEIRDEENIELDETSNEGQRPSEEQLEREPEPVEAQDPDNEIFSSVRDSFAILCVMNQYKLSSRLPMSESTLRENILTALFLDDDVAGKPGLVKHRAHVAVEIRRFRKRGVVPVLASLGWYFCALAISMLKVFGDVGNNSTAHNLALGLLMGWLPVLVSTAIIDRNSVDSEHVKVLLNSLMEMVHNHDVTFAKFVGQGRRRWHYGVAHPILSMLERYPNSLQRPVNWARVAKVCIDDNLPGHGSRTFSINYFSKWEFVHMLAAWLTIGMSVLGAWYISYNTPTVGLGCRSFSYAMFLVCCTLTGLVEFSLYPIIYRPVKKKHTGDSLVEEGFIGYLQSKRFRGRMNGVLAGLEVISTIVLLITIFMQTTGGFQYFWCRASLFGSRGGYIIFDTVVFINRFFDAIMYWTIGIVVSSIVPGVGTIWALREWLTQSFLWSSDVAMARRGLGRVRAWKGFWWRLRWGGRLNLKWLKGGIGWRP